MGAMMNLMATIMYNTVLKCNVSDISVLKISHHEILLPWPSGENDELCKNLEGNALIDLQHWISMDEFLFFYVPILQISSELVIFRNLGKSLI